MFTKEELEGAWDQVRQGGHAPGVDGVDLPAFAADIDAQLDMLAADFTEDGYHPQAYRALDRVKSSGGIRRIAIATLRDRVAQTALLKRIAPLLETQLSPSCFAYRTGIGVQDALEAVAAIRREGWRWGLCADIARFFESVPHPRIIRMLEAYGVDARQIDLIRQWLTTPYAGTGGLIPNTIGLPQGLPLSPLLSNVYLTPFDFYIARKQWRMVRYADDMALFFPHPDWAEECRHEVEEGLAALDLTLSEDKTMTVSFEQGFEFLGARFHQDQLIPALPHPYERDHTPPPPPPRRTLAQTMPHVQMRTLYIQEQGASLRLRGGRFMVLLEGQTLIEVYTRHVEQIFVFGRILISPQATSFCLQHQIPICLFSSHGSYFGLIHPADDIPVALRRAQFALADDPNARIALAREIVCARVRGERKLLQRHLHNHPETDLSELISRLRLAQDRADTCNDIEQMRGIEGAAAAAFFTGFGRCLRGPFSFTQRVRRPPTDPVNSLLSFGYSLTFYNVMAYLNARRIDPALGMYHESRTGHPALASDLVEEMRAPIVERLVLSLINRNQFGPEDFILDAPEIPGVNPQNLPCRLTDEARKRFLQAYEEYLARPQPHPDASEPVTWRRIMDLQALRFRRWVEGATEHYHAYRER